LPAKAGGGAADERQRRARALRRRELARLRGVPPRGGVYVMAKQVAEKVPQTKTGENKSQLEALGRDQIFGLGFWLAEIAPISSKFDFFRSL
jgi:hypothetical protein